LGKAQFIEGTLMALWKITCLENRFPGMWQRWFLHQAVGIGWPPEDGFRLKGNSPGGQGWSRARSAIQDIQIGDQIVVTLRGNRVGRIGYVTGKAIEDKDWNPLVPAGRGYPHGEMGRRINVRWDLMVGPDNRDMVVQLPKNTQFNSGELRPTIGRIQSITPAKLISTMNDPANWVGLLTHFDYERALSGYIAAYPHRLEDGMLPHPNEKIRERIFSDKTRLDVLLTDRNGASVIVECKQGTPTVANIKQLRNYLRHLKKETGSAARGILVHGGATKLSHDVAVEAEKAPTIEIVQYVLNVDFNLCF